MTVARDLQEEQAVLEEQDRQSAGQAVQVVLPKDPVRHKQLPEVLTKNLSLHSWHPPVAEVQRRQGAVQAVQAVGSTRKLPSLQPQVPSVTRMKPVAQVWQDLAEMQVVQVAGQAAQATVVELVELMNCLTGQEQSTPEPILQPVQE